MITDINDIYIVIPAKDEERFIGEVLESVLVQGFKKIIIVNDNSTDSTKQIIRSFDADITILDHTINLGAGAATQTGIQYAVSRGAKIIATMDADTQHNPADLIPMIKIMQTKNMDLVIGSRFLKKNDIPVTRLFFNFVGNIINYFITGLVVTDSQSGMKLMSRRFAEDLSITYNGFEFCIEIIKNAKIKKSNVYEYPIDVKYTKETMDKGQNIFTGFSMIGRFLNPFKS